MECQDNIVGLKWNVINPTGISWNVVTWTGRQVPQVSTKLPKFRNIPSLWLLGIGDRLLAAHGATMTLKVVLCQRLGEYVGNLIFHVDREYLDKSLAYMLVKTMIANIDVLGPWT